MIVAQVICDSISPQGKRLTTFRLRYPKFIHGEFMTHRMISRNASSSRAIPTSKYLEEVRSDSLRAAPLFWGKNQKGMQAAEELSDTQEPGFFSRRTAAMDQWRYAALAAADHAEKLLEIGAHKQIVNRILEPFLHINVVATATEWDNFFGLRLHKDAQPEMRMLAEAMWRARGESEPIALKPGKWHLPFVPRVEYDDLTCYLQDRRTTWKMGDTLDTAIRISVARCARVSYENFETGKRSTVEEDLALYDRLLGAQPLHASPAEHQATPDDNVGNEADGDLWANPKEWGNFIQWRQYRKMLPGEACAPLPEEYR